MTPSARPAELLAATIPMFIPVVHPGQRKVLDLGCGAVRTLSELPLSNDAIRVGLDLDPQSVKAVQRGAADAFFAAGDGHVLPFRSDYFDLVIAKGAFQLMNIPVALREVHRVLRPGGQVWMTLCPLRATAMRILADLRTGRLQDALYQTYVIVNGLMLEHVGWQFGFPFNRRRTESFQTVRGMTRALERAGFADVQYELRSRGPGYEAQDRKFGDVFAVAAHKKGGLGERRMGSAQAGSD
jgi:ubiquinone/menaquinone biosynthesis C-methylase UbiE